MDVKMKPKLYFLTFPGVDAFWLGLVAPGFYRSQIGHLMAETVNLPTAKKPTVKKSPGKATETKSKTNGRKVMKKATEKSS
jgi:hypothetical protein